MKMLITSHKLIVLLLAAMLLTVAVPSVSDAQTYSHIYVDAANGVNAATGRGAAAAPYKSITFALLISGKNNLPDPWHVHIRPGTYTGDPAKPATEREIFPIRLRNDMIFEGTTTADACIIDAQHLGVSTVPILVGENVEGIHIRNLTMKNMWMRKNQTYKLRGKLHSPIVAQVVLLGAGQKQNTLKGCIVHQDLDPLTIRDTFGAPHGLWSNMPLELVENTFSNNHARAVLVENTVVVTNNTFRNNAGSSLTISGGDSTGDITGNFFGNIRLGRHVRISDGFKELGGTFNGNIRDNTFDGGPLWGGGVQIDEIMNGDITHNTFINCKGVYQQPGGGALSVGTLNGNITHNVFTNNAPIRPGTPGGGVYVDTFNGNLTHNTFNNNKPGGVHIGTLTGNLTHNTFNNNTDTSGFHADYMMGDIADNEFTQNTGGGVTVLYELTGNITRNIFDRNIAKDNQDGCGGITLGGWKSLPKSVEISNNIFFNNKIGDRSHENFPNAGTLTIRQPVHVINNLFMMTSDEPINGKYKPHIHLSDLHNNPVPEGRFYNNIFVGMHIAIAIGGAYDFPITHNIFHNIGQDIVSQGGAGLGNDVAFWELLAENASNNLAVAPLLVDPLGAKDFHLQAASPAIDAGTNQYAPADDFEGAARPAGAAVDIGPYEYGATNRPNTVADVPETDTPTTTIDVPETTNARVNISPASVASPAIGEQLDFTLNITGGEAIAGYQASVQFDTTALRYVSGANGDYLPAGAFFVPPVVEGNLVKLNAASLAGESNGDGTLATLTFEVIAAKASTLTLPDVLLTNSAGEAFVPTVENAEITVPTGLKADVNVDGIVNIQDLVLVAGRLGQTGTNSADVNDDGVVNIQDLVLVAGALGTSAAAPSSLSQSLSGLTAADVNFWLSLAQQLNLTDAKSLRGIQYLEQFLEVLTPKRTALLPNFPNPFNPETWIPYQLAKDADVTLYIYAMNGALVRTITLGLQAAGLYQNRSRAAYWDGRNSIGEKVATGVYFYTLTTGDFTATRKMLIRK